MSSNPKIVLEDLISGLQEGKYTLEESNRSLEQSSSIRVCFYALKYFTNEDIATSIISDFIEGKSFLKIIEGNQNRLSTLVLAITTLITLSTLVITLIYEFIQKAHEKDD
ncbi:hypothetical protein [Sessilibacter corallicola]|uniref:hypothetical protein n=1 Tax=Sessilibacter corallicola TaxID=2904075 RepID=UPI001E3A2FC3|nr:hypothetical protein [Sessilibacter corallicola]MCE2029725.1 hypothetical protein [Sessilibacter corallicola]